jgi:hypothetical protein
MHCGAAQFVGNFTMESEGEVHVRCFGIFNLTLWDDVLAEFMPLTQDDVIMVNFGAWCAAQAACALSCQNPLLSSLRSLHMLPVCVKGQ